MSRRTGFTLIEIILVLFILILIASMGVPMMRGTLIQQQLKYSADQIRGEWGDAKVRAMDEGQIFCMRAKIGSSTIIISRVLDTHFTAGLSSRQTTSRFDANNAYDSFEKGGFTGDGQDFVLSNPDFAMEGFGTIIIKLPSTVKVADVLAVVEERSAFYMGLTDPSETITNNDDIEYSSLEAFLTGETRLGETPSADGALWSTPIFFYPDGSASTAAILLKNEAGRCIEIRLRGLTGTSTKTEIVLAESYIGEMIADRF